MTPEVAYLLIGIGLILVIYFMYLSYQSYQKSPSRWALRELTIEWISRLLNNGI